MNKLNCYVQNYKWGCKGYNSIISNYLIGQNSNIECDKEYAEFWMGTHINGESKIYINNSNSILYNSDYINENTIKLTKYLKHNNIYNDNNNQLPYLFKILSIEKPLSIQVHPSKPKAIELNKKYPDIYKDNKEKPELAIALDNNFQMFYGLKTIDNLCNYINKFVILKEILKKHLKFNIDCFMEFFNLKEKDNNKLYKSYLDLIIEILNLDKEALKEVLLSLINSKEQYFYNENNKNNQITIEYLVNEFGYDNGILFCLMMNYVVLNKGESIYITENIPHSYIRGNIIECMINSDFVIRLGLTCKNKDISNFVKILEEEFNKLIENDNLDKNINGYENIDLNNDEFNNCICKIFKIPNVKEFKVLYFKGNLINYKFDKCSILLVVNIDSSNDDSNNLYISANMNGNVINIKRYETYFLDYENNIEFKSNNGLNFELYVSSGIY